jgi:hypothetical protein
MIDWLNNAMQKCQTRLLDARQRFRLADALGGCVLLCLCLVNGLVDIIRHHLILHLFYLHPFPFFLLLFSPCTPLGPFDQRLPCLALPACESIL